MATSFQIKKIHTLKSILGIDEDLYRQMLSEFSAESSKNLSYDEATVFIDLLENNAESLGLWKIKPKKYEGINRSTSKISESQLRMIEGIWREICYFDNDEFAEKSLRKYLAIKFKVFDVKNITKAKASKIIQGILSMKRNLEKSAATLDLVEEK